MSRKFFERTLSQVSLADTGSARTRRATAAKSGAVKRFITTKTPLLSVWLRDDDAGCSEDAAKQRRTKGKDKKARACLSKRAVVRSSRKKGARGSDGRSGRAAPTLAQLKYSLSDRRCGFGRASLAVARLGRLIARLTCLGLRRAACCGARAGAGRAAARCHRAAGCGPGGG